MHRAVPVAFLLLSICAISAGAETPSAVTRTSPIRVWVDQINAMRSPARKSPSSASDARALPDEMQIELRDAKTGRAVWKSRAGSLTKYNAGKKDNESGEYIAHLDFSDFRKPGRYYFAWEAPVTLRSYMFNIAEHPFHDSGLAAWKAYYLSRGRRKGAEIRRPLELWPGPPRPKSIRPRPKSSNGKSAIAGPIKSAPNRSIPKLTMFTAAGGMPA